MQDQLVVQIPVNPKFPQSAADLRASAEASARRLCPDAVFVSAAEVTGMPAAAQVEETIRSVPGLRTYEFRFSGTRPDSAA